MALEAFQNAGQPLSGDDLYTGAIFCDCDGTLFTTKANGDFNENLFKFLIELKKAGHKVVIFSGESASNEGRVKLYSLKYTGNAEFFDYDGFIITPKDIVGPEKALLAIDDNHGSHNLKAQYQWNPDDPEIIAGIAAALECPEILAQFGTAPGLKLA